MFEGLIRFFLGECRVTFSAVNRAELFDFMYRSAIPFFDEREEGEYGSVSVSSRNCRALSCFFEENGYEYRASDAVGFPALLKFLGERPFLPLGLALCAVWLFFSQRIVWDIRIVGNSKTTEAEITEALESLGFGIGTYYPRVNFNRLHAEYVAVQNDIAWLSVYMNGTVAEIQVREFLPDERSLPSEGVFANVVAETDGVVREVRVFEGQAAVRAGDIVRAGDVLISGVVEKKDGGIRYEYAAGEVICEVAEPIRVDISLEREVKSYTGREKRKKTVKIFKKTINFFSNGGIEYVFYDKINTMEKLCPFGLCDIPVWVETEVYREYEKTVETISAREAAEEAMAALSRELSRVSSDAELVSRSFSVGTDGGVYSLECLLYLNRDIGKTVEFTYENFTDGAAAE